MGGAGRAGHNVAEGILLNPALLAQGQRTHYTFFNTTLSDQKSYYGLSFGKNEEELLFSLGLSYLSSEHENFLQFVFAKKIKDQWSWGLSVYRVKDTESGQEYKDWNMRAGLSLKLSPHLQWGLVYSHFLSSPGEERDFPREVSFGVEKVLSPTSLVRIDGVWRLEKKPQ